MQSKPLVSIITPLYNSARYITETITSVQNQTLTDWELILVNDASTDATKSIVTVFQQKDARIILLENATNLGAAYARNKALAVANGTYIAFLDADDLWHPTKLEKQVTFMQTQACSVSFTSYVHIDENGKELGKRINALPKVTYTKQHKNNYIGNLTGMYNASQLGKIEAPALRKRQDWAVWLEAIKRSDKPALGIQEPLAYYRVHTSSMSANKLGLLTYNFNFYRKYLGYSFLKASYHFCIFLIEYFLVRPKQIEQY